MKLIPDALQGPAITGYGTGWVAINGEKVHTSVVIHSSGHHPWHDAEFSRLQPDHFDQLLQWKPELVLFGSGIQHRFAHPKLLQNLFTQRIGVETMDTQAACRAYNFLSAEGRKVVAALLI